MCAEHLPGHTHSHPGHTWAPPWPCGCSRGHSGLMRAVRLMLDPKSSSSEHHRAPSARGPGPRPLRGHHTLPGTHRGVCGALNPRPGAQGHRGVPSPPGVSPAAPLHRAVPQPNLGGFTAAMTTREIPTEIPAGRRRRRRKRRKTRGNSQAGISSTPGLPPAVLGGCHSGLCGYFSTTGTEGPAPDLPGPARTPRSGHPDPWETNCGAHPPGKGCWRGLQP